MYYLYGFVLEQRLVEHYHINGEHKHRMGAADADAWARRSGSGSGLARATTNIR